MNEQRVVILVPTEQDLRDPEYRDKYWPNFVMGVQHALDKAQIKCVVRIAEPVRTGR